jgi:DNA topoisomerase-1
VPVLRPGSIVTAVEGSLLTKKTSPPKRFSEALLIREMERLEIGRPSTYASILENIKGRGYVTIDAKRFLVPTPDGEKAASLLVGKFSFLELDYTKRLEEYLDAIASGRASYMDVVSPVWSLLNTEIGHFRKETSVPCPNCSGPLRHLSKKASKKDPKEYDFFSCPGCKSAFDNKDGVPVPREKKERKETEYTCAVCGKPLLYHFKKDVYEFLGCSGYPGCRYTVWYDKNGQPDFENAKNNSN